jgi:hypothetical protein
MEVETATPLIEDFMAVMKKHLRDKPLGKRNAHEYRLLVLHMRQEADVLEEKVNKKLGSDSHS